MDLNIALVFAALVMVTAIFGSRISSKSGLPTLLVFLALGMFAGVDGPIGIDFEDYGSANTICSLALIFIMFYGGFGTNWKAAKPVAAQSITLASLGVALTALLTGLFCHLVFKMEILDAFLLGSVLSSTDAASVFSILRSKRLSLKYGTSSLLEMESGSNDPAAYLLVTVLLGIREAGTSSPGSIVYSVFAQVVYALLIGAALAWAASLVLRNFKFPEGFTPILVLAVAMLSYALPSIVGGNGYLSAYLCGIMLGNMKIGEKKELVGFFNAFNGMMQILIFFLLGLLSTPSAMVETLGLGIGVSVFMILIGRPLVVALITTPFRFPLRQQAVISMAGLRGASSIVFAITVTVAGGYGAGSIFNTVFFVVLVSILVQGGLLPAFSRKMGMIDNEEDVMKTFNDFQEESSVDFVPVELSKGSSWEEKRIRDLAPPPGTIVAAIERGGKEIIPKGDTVLKAGDLLTLAVAKPQAESSALLNEETIDSKHPWAGKALKDIDTESTLVLMINRDGQVIIPTGSTVIQKGDVLVKNEGK